MVHGANIRLSTMDLSILSQNKVSLMTLDEKYLPTAIVLPFEGHARQSKTEYTKLRKFLLKDGYIRIAPEVFMRVVQNRKASEKHYRRIDEVKPKTGVVRLLRLTERQYNNIYMVIGEPDYQEITVGVNCHIMI